MTTLPTTKYSHSNFIFVEHISDYVVSPLV